MNDSPTTFSGGQDHWFCEYRVEAISDRQKLFDAAKKGCPKAIAELQSGRHPIRTLTLDGVKIF